MSYPAPYVEHEDPQRALGSMLSTLIRHGAVCAASVRDAEILRACLRDGVDLIPFYVGSLCGRLDAAGHEETALAILRTANRVMDPSRGVVR